MGAGVQPGHAAPQIEHVQFPLFQVDPVEIGDFQLPPAGWLQRSGNGDDLVVVEVDARDGVVAARVFGFFFDADHFAMGVKVDHAVALRVADHVGKDQCARGELR